MLLHDVRPLVDEALEKCSHLRVERREEAEGAAWWEREEEVDEGPATTWPLGEILQARHDQLHSKIFNS